MITATAITFRFKYCGAKLFKHESPPPPQMINGVEQVFNSDKMKPLLAGYILGLKTRILMQMQKCVVTLIKTKRRYNRCENDFLNPRHGYCFVVMVQLQEQVVFITYLNHEHSAWSVSRSH